jgi:hypothetical protein
LSWGDADEALEMAGELTLVGEAGLKGDLRQGQIAGRQELSGPLDAAGDDVAVRRQPDRVRLPRLSFLHQLRLLEDSRTSRPWLAAIAVPR